MFRIICPCAKRSVIVGRHVAQQRRSRRVVDWLVFAGMFACVLRAIPSAADDTQGAQEGRANTDVRAHAAAKGTAGRPLRLFVATDGNDRWSGALPEPNAQGTDGPLATLEAARDAVRRLRRDGKLTPSTSVFVELRKGIYRRQHPLELSAEDSGTEHAPVVYRAHGGETVRLIGGPVLRGFEPVADQSVLQGLPEEARRHVVQINLKNHGVEDFGSPAGGGVYLYFNDQPMTLARWPNQGFTHIEKVVGGQPFKSHGRRGDRVGKFVYKGDRPARWAGEKNLWVHGYWFWDWSDQRQAVDSIDVEHRTITLKPPYHHYGYREGAWYYAFNALSELDSPGEWYLDRQTGMLYFWPPSELSTAEVIVSSAHALFAFRGASHIVVDGLAMEATRGTAVSIHDGLSVEIRNCTLRNIGDWAVIVRGGQKHRVSGCDIYHQGAGGISLAGGDRPTLQPAAHVAEDNHIHHYALWHRTYRPAISLSGVGNIARHNLIHHAPHEAIAMGGNDHRIELNEIHHVCEESNDAGAIYGGRDWTMRGIVIRHNFLHHITGFEKRGCVGVYLDDMFCGTRIEGNVFYQVTRAAFIGGGRDNVVANNLFVECSPALHVDARGIGWAASSKETLLKRLRGMPYQSALWRERYPRLPAILDDEPMKPKGNVVRCNVVFGGRWDEIETAARAFLKLENNHVQPEAPEVIDAQGKFHMPQQAERLPSCFQSIPFEQIGPRRPVNADSSAIR